MNTVPPLTASKAAICALVFVFLAACSAESATNTPSPTSTREPTSTSLLLPTLPPTDTPVSTAMPTSVSAATPTSVSAATPTSVSAATPTATDLPPTDTATPASSPTSIATAVPDIPLEEVNFLTEDGIDIAGTLIGDGEIVVMFLHQGKGSVTQNSWKPFALLAAEQGFAALVFDFRGRGKSGGSVHESFLPKDAQAAVEFLRDRGYTRLVCVGAGMWGGWPCTLLALEGGVEGLAVLSSPMAIGPTGSVSVEELAALTVPKLYVYGEKDYEGVAENMAEVYRVSGEPKEQVVYDTSARGTNLFRSPYADDLTQQLLGFLQGFRSP